MKKLSSTLVAAFVLAACAQKSDPAQQYRDVLPQAEIVQIGTPSAEPNAGALSARSDALGQSPSYGSEYAQTSYWTAVSVNGGVWWTLTLVKVITAFPPSADCSDTSCTWGPWAGDDGLNEWKFHADKVADHFEYQLSARAIAGAAPWTDLLTGTAFPGADRNHGNGSFTVYFDRQDALPHPDGWVKQDYGTLDVNYDNRTRIAIDATLAGGKDQDPANPHMMDATYSFRRDPGHGGDLGLGVVNVDTSERLSLHTRWDGTGAGRSDVHYQAAGGSPDFTSTECWAGAGGIPPWVPAFGETYDDKVPFGTEATDCVFNPADFLPLP